MMTIMMMMMMVVVVVVVVLAMMMISSGYGNVNFSRMCILSLALQPH
jgi:hypothetical protein